MLRRVVCSEVHMYFFFPLPDFTVNIPLQDPDLLNLQCSCIYVLSSLPPPFFTRGLFLLTVYFFLFRLIEQLSTNMS